MEVPKDYSSVYCEEKAPVPATRGTTKTLDGSYRPRRHREAGGIDPKDLLPRLYHLSQEQTSAYANHALHQHYNSVILMRNRQTYKVYINYLDDGKKSETYLVRVGKNTLRDVKAKLPIKGEYRLFFIHPGDECEEVEDDDSSLPYHEVGGDFTIYCRVFKK